MPHSCSLLRPVTWSQYPKNLFIPNSFPESDISRQNDYFVSAVIPTFKPPKLLIPLVERLLTDPYVKQVVVIDDATPYGYEEIFSELINAVRQSFQQHKFTLLKLEQNQKRAGAVNAGLKKIYNPASNRHDILVLDDDVSLASRSIENLIRALHSNESFGAVCSQARVQNRRKNLLTRLQGLEYLGFNISRIADRGFLYGPLIMHGLASLIRSTVLLEEVQGYDEKQLLEDYDLTVRIKSKGFHVALAESAIATTTVPETFVQIWRQRIRWQFGGMSVITSHWDQLKATFPDVMSHLVTLVLLGSITFSMFWHDNGNGGSTLITAIRTTSIAVSIIFYLFQIITFLLIDKGRDRVDVMLRLLLLPEFIYSLLLSFVLFGSYIFFAYTRAREKILFRQLRPLYSFIDRVFAAAGYTSTWGTK